MRKPLKVTLLTVGVIIALPVVALTTTSIVNVVATSSEASAITSYGQRVSVDGKQMNVVDSGAGPDTIVLLPGLGTAAPGLDFQPLITALSAAHRVIAVEPFGTGLSDQTSAPRTAENIAREVHEALQQLGVTRYVLMGHSIAGVYALQYSALYADELVAFVGIDSSVPNQPGSDTPVPTDGLVALRDLGILRVVAAVSGDAYAGKPYDEKTKEQMRLLSTKNSTQPTMLDEMNRSAENFASVADLAFPRSLPVLLFVISDDADVTGWIRLHEEQAAGVERGRVVVLNGEHYLHHTRSAEMASETTAFLESLSVR